MGEAIPPCLAGDTAGKDMSGPWILPEAGQSFVQPGSQFWCIVRQCGGREVVAFSEEPCQEGVGVCCGRHAGTLGSSPPHRS